jgi:hypothetical protein
MRIQPPGGGGGQIGSGVIAGQTKQQERSTRSGKGRTMRHVAKLQIRTRVVVCAFAFGVPCFAIAQTVESTGFESDAADGGWEAGFSVCGSGGLSPNPNSGWASTLCTEPHIETDHPASGTQHLRFVHDPAMDLVRCEFLDCPNQIATPPQGSQPVAPTRISFDIATDAFPSCFGIAGSSRADLFVIATSASEIEPSTASVRFYREGVVLVSSNIAGEEVGIAFLNEFFRYDRMVIELDPCTNTQTYTLYDLNGAVGGIVQNFDGKSLTVEQVIFTHDNYYCTWDIDNLLIERGEPCETGSCCDRAPGRGGVCSEFVLPQDCVGEFLEWHEPLRCPGVVCSEITGACCDSSPGTGGACTNDVLIGDCGGEHQNWTPGALCGEVVCEEVTGACCDRTPGQGSCLNDLLASECVAANEVWTINATCDDVTCNEIEGACCNTLSGDCVVSTIGDCLAIESTTWAAESTCAEDECTAATGACCDTGSEDPTLATCTTTTLATCDCDKCTWTRDVDCGDVLCDPNFQVIPVTSEWGLLVLALALLVAAKVHSRPAQTERANA